MKKFPKKLGPAFFEGLEISRKRKLPKTSADLASFGEWGKKFFQSRFPAARFEVARYRLIPIYIFIAACFLILLARSFDLQVIQGKLFLEKAEGNQVRLEVNHAPRGVIFDRNGAVLAQNQPGFRLKIATQDLSEEKKKLVVSKLAAILEMPESALWEKLGKNPKEEEITIANDLLPDKARLIEAEKEKLPGVELEINPVRSYPYKEITAHVLGYATEAAETDLARRLARPYERGDKVGKAGVEAAFEEMLRGRNGYRLVKVTARGEKKGEIYQKDPTPGQNVTLSIDIKLQKFVYEVLAKQLQKVGAKAGSAVVLDPNTGEILSLVSLPSYDNNIFTKGLTDQAYQELISSSEKKLLNRVVGAGYPPGSTFKMITAAAALETGTITKETKIVDPGFITLGGRVFQNWLWSERRQTEGAINLTRAMVRSTDTFFFELALRMGEKPIVDFARKFGLGAKSGSKLPEEIAGLVPDRNWKLIAKGEDWYPGETLNLSIGQGDLLVTPLQLSLVTAFFANSGKLLTPTLLKKATPEIARENFLKVETVSAVREAIHQVVVGAGGLSWVFGGAGFDSAGKTGTAESGSERPHAWYTGFAPYDNPRLVATVMVENAGHGSEVAAPVVKQIFEWWFANRNEKDQIHLRQLRQSAGRF